MRGTKKLKARCQACGRAIEYPAELVGTTVDCPHCHQATELLLEVPSIAPVLPRRAIAYALVAVVILVLGLAGALIALKRAERMATERRGHGTPPAITNQSAPPPER